MLYNMIENRSLNGCGGSVLPEVKRVRIMRDMGYKKYI